MLASKVPTAIQWGQKMLLLYNDAYLPMLQSKHLWALGLPLLERKRASHAIECFDEEIRQVLNNLVGNAIDAMLPGGGKLYVRSREGYSSESLFPAYARSHILRSRSSANRRLEPSQKHLAGCLAKIDHLASARRNERDLLNPDHLKNQAQIHRRKIPVANR